MEENIVKEIFVYYLLFLIVFTMHEFEEVLFLTKWLNKNGNILKNKFRKRPINKIVKEMDEVKFGLIVLEEYLLLLGSLIYVVLTDKNIIFVGVVIGYTFHIIVHIIQALVAKKYIPGLSTGIISGGISIYIAYKMINLYAYHFIDIVEATFIIFSVIVLNLLICHFVVNKLFERNDQI
jgi:hypothetical protein